MKRTKELKEIGQIIAALALFVAIGYAITTGVELAHGALCDGCDWEYCPQAK